ncbi:MAG: MGMT family protein [Myxococcota bacterium]|nr:MGMT family protein [Myxococcota bacterium]
MSEDDRMVDGEPRIVGPGFYDRVYAMVRQVPAGRVAAYGDVATMLGSPRVARHVGWALAGLPPSEADVPWHRIINSRGRISFKGQTVRAELQRQRLESEGIIFSDAGVVDLKRFRHRW